MTWIYNYRQYTAVTPFTTTFHTFFFPFSLLLSRLLFVADAPRYSIPYNHYCSVSIIVDVAFIFILLINSSITPSQPDSNQQNWLNRIVSPCLILTQNFFLSTIKKILYYINCFTCQRIGKFQWFVVTAGSQLCIVGGFSRNEVNEVYTRDKQCTQRRSQSFIC